MDRRGNSDDEVAEAALKLMGYEWDKRAYTNNSDLYSIKLNGKLKVQWALPRTTSITEFYEYITRLK